MGRRILLVMMILIMFATMGNQLIPLSATAMEDGSITLQLKSPVSQTPIINAQFQLYFIAMATIGEEEITYDYLSPYNESNIELGDFQDPSLSKHLLHFAQSRNLPATTKKTDEAGRIVFENLMPGAYLIAPSEGIIEGYTLAPFITNIPHYDEAIHQFQYHIEATSKIGILEENPLETYLSVRKKWDANVEHPKSVTVVLLRDMKEFDTAILSQENDWHYRWDHLAGDHVWDVVEKGVPDGFTAQYIPSSNTMTIYNKSLATQKPPAEKPSAPPDKLVQTGQLNWPIPILAALGLLLFAIGWAIVNLDKNKQGEDQ